MNEDKNFDLRNALNAELAQLMSNLSANTSPIGDWKVIKCYEARMQDKPMPYDFDALTAQRAECRKRINEIEAELQALN